MTTASQQDRERLAQSIARSAAVIGALQTQADRLLSVCDTVVTALRAGFKTLAAGNGGSAAEAMHFTEELVGRFKSDRIALPALALVADPTVLTCIGNDFGYDRVFSRQIEALGQPGDILVLFSTSGNSRNLTLALDTAQSKGMTALCLLGRDGGRLAGKANHEIIVNCQETERIQEAHQVIVHLILDAVERAFAPAPQDSH